MTDVSQTARRLHIGGRQRREGWEILDAIAGEQVDHLGDAADLSRFPDGTFVELYASHVLEHFDYHERLGLVLREWRRVLQPGGTLYVSVPDLERLCHLYLTPGLAPDARFHIMRMMFGGHVDAYDYHLCGIDERYLATQLQAAGYSAGRRVQSFNLFNDTSAMQFLGVPISLNMIATR
ncbi:MAG: methyltransferase domain-containing protein [Chromatiales bacterium]|nr:methyltransferase domain-containing protein [Chromatiales bacterium]